MTGANDPALGLLVAFVRAARQYRQGRTETGLVSLLPIGLTEEELDERVHAMVAVGAVLTGVMTVSSPALAGPAERPIDALAGRFAAAGAQLDTATIWWLIEGHCPGLPRTCQVLTDVLIALVSRFAARDLDSPHAALIDDLGRVPDIEAALAAIVPRPPLREGDR